MQFHLLVHSYAAIGIKGSCTPWKNMGKGEKIVVHTLEKERATRKKLLYTPWKWETNDGKNVVHTLEKE